jgi:hypothetical protein
MSVVAASAPAPCPRLVLGFFPSWRNPAFPGGVDVPAPCPVLGFPSDRCVAAAARPLLLPTARRGGAPAFSPQPWHAAAKWKQKPQEGGGWPCLQSTPASSSFESALRGSRGKGPQCPWHRRRAGQVARQGCSPGRLVCPRAGQRCPSPFPRPPPVPRALALGVRASRAARPRPVPRAGLAGPAASLGGSVDRRRGVKRREEKRIRDGGENGDCQAGSTRR